MLQCSKYKPQLNPGSNSGLITHITPSTTQNQASVMIWGRPGYSIYQAEGRVLWGLQERYSKIFPCSSINSTNSSTTYNTHNQKINNQQVCTCDATKLTIAEAVCANRTRYQVEADLVPFSVIEVPRDSIYGGFLRLKMWLIE